MNSQHLTTIGLLIASLLVVSAASAAVPGLPKPHHRPELGNSVTEPGRSGEAPNQLSAAARRAQQINGGGRVLSVTAVAQDLAAARALAYEGVASVSLRGGHWRTDIAGATEAAT